MAYDPSTPAGRVRLLISDVDDNNQVFVDEEIDAFLDMAGSNVRLAAADALDVIAGNETLRLKYVRSRGLELDGPAVGRELRLQAKQHREVAMEQGAADDVLIIVDNADGYDLGDPTWPYR